MPALCDHPAVKTRIIGSDIFWYRNKAKKYSENQEVDIFERQDAKINLIFPIVEDSTLILIDKILTQIFLQI